MRRAGVTAVLLGALGAALLASPPTAIAQTKPDAAVVEGKKRAAEGRRLLQRKKYEQALVELEAAHGLDPRPSTLKAIGDALSGMGRSVEAFESYEQAFALPGDPLLPHERRQLEQAMVELGKQIATVKLEVEPADAAVQIDGVQRGKAPLAAPLRLAPGSHKVVVTAPKHRPFEQTVSVAGGDTVTVVAKLVLDATTGILVVREETGKAARVVVEGLDAGDAPQRIHAAPGRYKVALAAGNASGPARDVEVKLGETIDIALTAPAQIDEYACGSDDDCYLGERCRTGRCIAVRQRAPAKLFASKGEDCSELECAEKLSCFQNVCHVPEDLPPQARDAIGVAWQMAFGLSGDASYPAPLHALGLRMEFGVAPRVRLHVAAGYANLNGWSGLKVSPIAVGFPIPLYSSGQTHFMLEPAIEPINVTGVFSDTGHVVLFGLATWARASLHHKSYFVALEPVGLQFDFAQVAGNAKLSAALSEPSIAYFTRLGVGSHF